MDGLCTGKISRDIERNCLNPVTRGLESSGIIVNREDLKSYTFEQDSTTDTTLKGRPNVITKIELVTGAKAYKIGVPPNNPFSGTTTALAAGTYINTFTNTVTFVIFGNDPDVNSEIVDGLANGSFVVILENKYKNLNKSTRAGDSTFQIYGLYQGLKATALENDKYSEDTDGGYLVTLTETRVPRSAVYFYDTDLETTRSKLQSLTVE